MAYRLRFPFRSTAEVTDFTALISLNCPGVEASLEPNLPYVVLNLDGFESESAAAEAVPFAWGAVMLASVLAGWGFQAESSPARVAHTDDPDRLGEHLRKSLGLRNTGPVYGIVDGNAITVIPLGKTINFITGGHTVRPSVPASRIAPHLERALAYKTAGRVLADERLKLALALWSDYHNERSLRAKFLTLMMALEVLAPPADKHSAAQAVIDRWDDELASELGRYQETSDEYEAIDSLRREILFRRERSIRSRIRKHVRDVLATVSPDHARQADDMVVGAYHLRGKLVHEGSLTPADLSKGHSFARQVLRMLLLVSFGVSDLGSVGA